MAGPNLELIKFGMYVFFPIGIMIHYGDPDWYRKYVLPEKNQFLKIKENEPIPPRNKFELERDLKELKELKNKKLEKKMNEENENRNRLV
ncbi:hypothetical protein DFH28DRAFT_1092460 [Melampsora americana]|nr:hypothetical protein DFH28DRAFT_1092460 [Melampsora americana]